MGVFHKYYDRLKLDLIYDRPFIPLVALTIGLTRDVTNLQIHISL